MSEKIEFLKIISEKIEFLYKLSESIVFLTLVHILNLHLIFKICIEVLKIKFMIIYEAIFIVKGDTIFSGMMICEKINENSCSNGAVKQKKC